MAPTRPGPVLVTGANSGIGLDTVIRLATRGWDTWGTVRTAAKGDDVMAEADEFLGQSHPADEGIFLEAEPRPSQVAGTRKPVVARADDHCVRHE